MNPTHPLEFDPHAVLASLGFKDYRLERLHLGLETDVWRVEAGEVYALRVFRPGESAKGVREALALRTAAAAGIPVPEVVAQGIWQDRGALLLTWLPGEMLGLELTQKTPLKRLRFLSETLGQTLAAIHRVPAPKEWQRDPYRWVGLAGPSELALQERLRSLPLKTDALLHLDFHPFNVMFGGERVTGVLDWSGAAAGDPRADVAKFVTLARFAPVTPRPGAPGRTPEEIALRQHIVKAFEKGYREAGDADDVSGDDMPLFYAWAGAATVHNVRAKIGKPGETVQEHHLDGVRDWTERWKRRAGLTFEMSDTNAVSDVLNHGLELEPEKRPRRLPY